MTNIMRFILVLVLIFYYPAFAQDTYYEHEKLKEIKEELKEHKEKLRITREKEQQTLSKLFVIARELGKTQKELNLTKARISQSERKIKDLGLELIEAEKKLKEEEKGLRERIIEVYKSPGINYLELLLSGRILADVLNRAYYFEKIIEADIKLITEIREDEKKTREIRKSLSNAVEEVKEFASVIENKKAEIKSQAEQKREVYELLKERRKQYEKRVAELERSSKELEYLIRQKVAERSKKKLPAPYGSGILAWPAYGRLISGFGYRRHPIWGGTHFHAGIDIATSFGTPVVAADSGIVIFSGWWDGYGKAVVIDHGKGRTTVYGHLGRIYVEAEQDVSKTQVIGLVGSTGYSTGPHLHFEVRQNGTPIDPLGLL